MKVNEEYYDRVCKITEVNLNLRSELQAAKQMLTDQPANAPFPQTQPDGADSGAENPVEDGLTSQPIAAPHVRHCLVSFNLPFSEIVRHHVKPGETHGIQLKSSLHGDHHKGDLQRKSTIQVHLELDVKVRRELPANALIRTKFKEVMKHFIQKVKSL